MNIFAPAIRGLSIAVARANFNNLGSVGEVLKSAEEIYKSISDKEQDPLKNALKQFCDVLESFIMGEFKRRDEGISKITAMIGEIESHVILDCPIAKPAVNHDEIREYASSAIATVEELESDLIKLEKKSYSKELLNAIFRAVHTLKGETGFAGLTGISELLHRYEGVFALLRDKPFRLSSKDIDLLLLVVDIVKKTFQLCIGDTATGMAKRFPDECLRLDELISNLKGDYETIPELINLSEIEDASIYSDFIHEAREHLENIEVRVLELETKPSNFAILDEIFRPLHTIKGVSGFLALNHINRIAHNAETLLDHARNGRIGMDRECVDLIFEVLDMLRKLIGFVELQICGKDFSSFQYPSIEQLIDKTVRLTSSKLEAKAIASKEEITIKPEKPLGQILVDANMVSKEDVDNALKIQQEEDGERKLGEILLDNEKISAKEISDALRKQIDTASIKQEGGAVKVSVEKLDGLIDMVGELVISQTLISQNSVVLGRSDQQLSKNVSHLSKIVRDIQFIAMSLRMVPIKATFQKMGRLVRDLSVKSGKKVELAISGAETELDKNVVEQINDPLVHMIRNSVDHGIELPADRSAKGKSEIGHISLNAYHQGGNIIIEVVDDGKGLDCNAIRKKGIERKLIKENTDLSDNELFQLIFEPGFSTAEKITDVSGRGVGMDVVRKNIEKLGGMVSIASEKGKGSVFTIRLPLTMAILDGMILKVGEQRYLMPIISIKESIQPEQKDVSTIQGKGEVVNVRGSLIQLIRLSKVFSEKANKNNPCEAIVMIVEHKGKSYGIMVDEILGQQQVVIKSLKGEFRETKGISGASILGDGRVGLILDVKGLVELAVDKTL